MTIGYRSFARSTSKDARVRRAISSLVAGGAASNVKIEPFGDGQIELNGEVLVNGTILGAGPITISSSTDSAASNSTIYWSTTQNALVYKHSNGAIYLFTLVLAH